MVRNYKWNIEKKKVLDIAKENISEIIKETNSNCIEMNELVTLLNSRTHFLNLKNMGSHRTMTNFLKSNCKGTLNFIESLEDFFVIKKDNKIFVSYNNKTELFCELDSWIYINSENIES